MEKVSATNASVFYVDYSNGETINVTRIDLRQKSANE